VLRDLVHAPAEVVAPERSRVATEGWGARLLALNGDDASGTVVCAFRRGTSTGERRRVRFRTSVDVLAKNGGLRKAGALQELFRAAGTACFGLSFRTITGRWCLPFAMYRKCFFGIVAQSLVVGFAVFLDIVDGFGVTRGT
jgi:hypothetical protein